MIDALVASLTLEIALGAQVRDAESQDRQLVQLGEDALVVGQETRQHVELRVEALPVAFGGIRLGLAFFGLDADAEHADEHENHAEGAIAFKFQQSRLESDVGDDRGRGDGRVMR